MNYCNYKGELKFSVGDILDYEITARTGRHSIMPIGGNYDDTYHFPIERFIKYFEIIDDEIEWEDITDEYEIEFKTV